MICEWNPIEKNARKHSAICIQLNHLNYCWDFNFVALGLGQIIIELILWPVPYHLTQCGYITENTADGWSSKAQPHPMQKRRGDLFIKITCANEYPFYGLLIHTYSGNWQLVQLPEFPILVSIFSPIRCEHSQAHIEICLPIFHSDKFN